MFLNTIGTLHSQFFYMRKLYCVLFLIIVAAPVFAQDDSLKVKDLEEVIVSTGQYRPQSVKNSVYQVRVISAEQIRKQAAAKLQDVLSSQLNIRFSQDLATGGSDITMMGLSGQNVKILIDGVPMIGRQGTSNEININQIEVNSIERIEIIEGPMSVIYGADALAGVINIITKKPGREKFAINARVQEETVGKEYGWNEGIHNQYLGASGQYKNWYASGGIGRNLFQGWKDTATGRELTWHKKDQIVGNAVVGYRNSRLNVYYRLDGLDEIITNPANLPGGNQPAVDQDYITDRLMQQLQASYKFNKRLSANALASYTHFTRQVYSTLFYPNGDVRIATAPGLQTISTFNGFTFRGTAVYTPSSFISFQPGVDINTESGDGERIKTGVQRITDYSFFLTSEITPASWINIRPGLRVVKNSVYDAPPVIPSINTKILLSRNVDLRLAYARGFRAPSLRELYYDFFDASHSIKGNPNLEAEHSNSFTGSLTWNAIRKKQTRFNTTLSGFYNDVTNMIGYAADPANPTVTTYVNIAKYKTRGASLTGQLIAGNLDASLGIGYTGRYNDYSEVDKDLPTFKWSPELTSIVSYSFPKLGLSANIYYKLTGKLPYYQQVTENGQTEIRLAETEAYHWADFTLNKKLLKVLTINAGIRNLFDVTAIANSAVSGGAHSSAGAR
ncbi:MAG: TonB-dependent receptor, partial [Chitinophagaceae bacterium]